MQQKQGMEAEETHGQRAKWSTGGYSYLFTYVESAMAFKQKA
jgi:hypothetical protein